MEYGLKHRSWKGKEGTEKEGRGGRRKKEEGR